MINTLTLKALKYVYKPRDQGFLGLAVDQEPIKFILPESMSYLGEVKKRGAVCGKRLTFLYTSPYEHDAYNVWGP